MPQRKLQAARCLVTGASSGIGRAIAEHLVRQGARVILTGRSAERLDAIVSLLRDRQGDAVACPADLTVAEDLRRLIEATRTHFDGSLDVVVNAAGVGAYGRFESHQPEVLRQVFEVNLFALAEVTRAAHALLRRGRRPILVNIGSIVARRGLSGRSEYSASKFAVAGLTEALRAEWSYDGIDILLVNPGWTDTPFERNLVVDTAFVKTSRFRAMSADLVAERVIKAIRQGRREVTVSLSGRTLIAVNRLAPWFVDWSLGLWTRRLYARHHLDQLRED